MGRTTVQKEGATEEVAFWMRKHGKHTTRVNGVKKRYPKGTSVPFPKGVTPSGKDWERVGPAPAVEEREELPNTSGLKLEAKGGGWYNVLNAETGEAINNVGLKLEAAEALIAEMSGDEDEE